MKAVKVSIILDELEASEEFLRGLIVARSNNSSPYFVQLIDGVNEALQEARGTKLAEEMKQRSAAGMP